MLVYDCHRHDDAANDALSSIPEDLKRFIM